MLFGETVAVYCENHTQHINTLCGQNAEFWYVKAGVAYRYYYFKALMLSLFLLIRRQKWISRAT
jgi:hypothetical protein